MVARKARRMRRRRWLLWKAQGFLCPSCGQRICPNFGRQHPRRMTLDEVVPKARGGRPMLGNQLVMHLQCNAAKGALMPTGCERIWLAMVNARLAAKFAARGVRL